MDRQSSLSATCCELPLKGISYRVQHPILIKKSVQVGRDDNRLSLSVALRLFLCPKVAHDKESRLQSQRMPWVFVDLSQEPISKCAHSMVIFFHDCTIGERDRASDWRRYLFTLTLLRVFSTLFTARDAYKALGGDALLKYIFNATYCGGRIYSSGYISKAPLWSILSSRIFEWNRRRADDIVFQHPHMKKGSPVVVHHVFIPKYLGLVQIDTVS